MSKLPNCKGFSPKQHPQTWPHFAFSRHKSVVIIAALRCGDPRGDLPIIHHRSPLGNGDILNRIFTALSQPVRQYLIHVVGFQRNSNELIGQPLKITAVSDQYLVTQKMTGDGFCLKPVQFCQNK